MLRCVTGAWSLLGLSANAAPPAHGLAVSPRPPFAERPPVLTFMRITNTLCNMSLTLLDRIPFWAHHGYYEEERLLGNRFLVTVSLDLNPADTKDFPDLALLLDTPRVMTIVRAEMRQPSQLLEHVGHRIEQRLLALAPKAVEKEKVKCIVTLYKCNPPLGGVVGYSVVDTTGRIGLEAVQLMARQEPFAVPLHASVYVRSDVKKAKEGDDLADTVNYESIHWAIQGERRLVATDLAERAHRIAHRLRMQHRGLNAIEVVLEVPQGGGVERIELSEKLEIECTRCKKSMQCYGAAGGDCWCREAKIPPAKGALLKASFEGCLCPKCLGDYGITIGSGASA